MGRAFYNPGLLPVPCDGHFAFTDRWRARLRAKAAASALGRSFPRTPRTGPLSTLADPSTPTTHRAADERVLVLDFGSQYAQLIARRVREQNVFCEIVRHDITAERVARARRPRALFSRAGLPACMRTGRPASCDPGLFDLGVPVLGICYGMQLACNALGGKVDSAPAREYGRARCQVTASDEPV